MVSVEIAKLDGSLSIEEVDINETILGLKRSLSAFFFPSLFG